MRSPSYVTWLIHMGHDVFSCTWDMIYDSCGAFLTQFLHPCRCDMTRDLFIRHMTHKSLIFYMTHAYGTCGACPGPTSAPLYVWHDSWLIHTSHDSWVFNVTRAYGTWDMSRAYGTWLKFLHPFVCDMTRDLSIRDMTHESFMCDMTHAYGTWSKSRSYGTWLLHIRFETYDLTH